MMKAFLLISVLGLFLVGCRTAPPTFAELPDETTGAQAEEDRGPFADIVGARPGIQQQEIASALISAMHRRHASTPPDGSWESEVQRSAKLGAIWILKGDKLSISLAGMSADEIELALRDLRGAGLAVTVSE